MTKSHKENTKMKQETMEKARKIALTGDEIWKAANRIRKYFETDYIMYLKAEEEMHKRLKGTKPITSREIIDDYSRTTFHYQRTLELATKTKIAIERLMHKFEAALLESEDHITASGKIAAKLNRAYDTYVKLVRWDGRAYRPPIRSLDQFVM